MSFSFRGRLAGAMAAASLAVPSFCARAFAAGPATGVIVISVDALRADAPEKVMPRWSAFARSEATTFDRARAAATWTLPSHASMLFSAAPARWRPLTRETGATLPRAPAALSERFAAAGFRTALFHESKFFEFGLTRGFTTALESTSPLAEANGWLVKNSSVPFFLFVHTYSVHDYAFLDPSKKGACRYAKSDSQLRARNRATCSSRTKAYEAAARCLDEELGRFLDSARALPGWRDWLVILTSDHGEALCEKRGGREEVGHGGAPYEELLRVPLVIKRPGALPPAKLSSPASHLDLGPVALSAAHLPPAPEFEGRDVLSSPRSESEALVLGAESSVVILRNWKYFEDGEALYDLARDPGETRNLSSTRPRDARRLRQVLEMFYARTPLARRRLVVNGRAGERFELIVRADPPLRYWRALLARAGDESRAADGGFRATFTLRENDERREFVFDPSAGEPSVSLTRDGVASPQSLVARDQPSAWPWPENGSLNEKTLEALRAAGYLP